MKITKLNFAKIARSLGYEVEEEFKFSKDRRFRADWKINQKNKKKAV